MNRLIILLLTLSGIMCHGQADRITFSYDDAGNQELRRVCFGCTSWKTTNDTPKEISALKEEDFIKFFSEDIISYYPNPVREELYLKWELIDNNLVKSVEVCSVSGQVIKSYSRLESVNTRTISFQEYPSGVYVVVLFYSNGENKSIKIIKQ